MTPGIIRLIDSSLVHKFRFDTISNNLANINTIAFKKDIYSFSRILTMKNFSRPDLTPGPVRYTGNQLDVALEAPGFFKVQTSKGIKYSKDGSFTLNKDQFLVNQRGDTVLGQGGPIQITGNKVSISTDGSVVVDDAPLDRILVVDFKHPQLLTKEGSSYFTYKGEEQDISTAENVNILQGYIETSNVNPTEEMIKMVETFRVFEAAQKAIQSLDDITGKMVNDQGIF